MMGGISDPSNEIEYRDMIEVLKRQDPEAGKALEGLYHGDDPKTVKPEVMGRIREWMTQHDG